MKEIVLFMPPFLVIGQVKDWPPAKGKEFEYHNVMMLNRGMQMTPEGPQDMIGVQPIGRLWKVRPGGWQMHALPESKELSAYNNLLEQWQAARSGIVKATTTDGLPPAPGEPLAKSPPGLRGPMRLVPPGRG